MPSIRENNKLLTKLRKEKPQPKPKHVSVKQQEATRRIV